MNVIIYKRVSTDDQADRGFSLQNQEDMLIKYCNIQKHNIVGIYTEDYSAKTFDRPEWKKIMLYIKKNRGKVDLILCLRWDRFSRNQYEALTTIKELFKLGVSVNTMEQPLDLSNPDNKVLLSLYLTIPEVENDKNSIRTTEGSRRARFEGCWTGTPPRGYENCRVDKKSTLRPSKDAEIMKEAFTRMASGLYSADEVRRWINSQGIKMVKQTFLYLIRNVVYIGKIYIKPWKKEPEQIVTGLHPPLITEDVFYRAIQVLDGRVRKMDFDSDKTDLYPIKGFMECEKHKRTISAYPSTGRNGKLHHYYICTLPKCSRYRVDDVHKKISELISEISFDAKMILLYKSFLEDIFNKEDNVRLSEIEKTKTEIDKLEKRKISLENSFMDGDLTSIEYHQMKLRTDSECLNLNEKLSGLQSDLPPFKFYLKKTLPALERMSDFYEKSDGKTKKKILGCIFLKKFNSLEFKVATTPFTPEVVAVITAGKVSRNGENKKEVSKDLFSLLAPPLGLEPRTL